jgi:hypothetical protein
MSLFRKALIDAIDRKRAESFGELSALFAFGVCAPFSREESCYGEFLSISSKLMFKAATTGGPDRGAAPGAAIGGSGGMAMSNAFSTDLLKPFW